MSDFISQRVEYILNYFVYSPSAKILRYSRLKCRKVELTANIKETFQPDLDLSSCTRQHFVRNCVTCVRPFGFSCQSLSPRAYGFQYLKQIQKLIYRAIGYEGLTIKSGITPIL